MPADGASAFGSMLKTRRLAASLTQEALAELAGMSARAIADLERGVIRAPRRDTLDMLAEALGLTEDERHEWHQLRRELSVRTSHVSTRASLPVPPNPLIGREREVNALVNLITQADNRLVTITGPGGVGKTRIALAVGHELFHRFPDGVHLVELASIRDPELLVPAVAQHLGIRDGDPDVLRERLMRVLAHRNMLLILDNAEHLRRAAADLASLLAGTQTLHMLVTSRAGLRISAEHEFPVDPLRLPEWDSSPDVSLLHTYPAIQLFVQRAQQVRPDFTLTEDNAPAISRICAYLDGLPLAIELAAARVRVLPPAQIVPKLVDRLTFLTDGLVDAPDRHQTMRAAIGWSYDLLDPPQQQFLHRLSTFVGGWTLEAAEAMAPAGLEAVDGLAWLANDNLIRQTNSSDSEVRFTMLETVREFGLQQLDALDEREQALESYAGYFLHFVERAEPELRGPNQPEWLRRLADDMSNIRNALVWAERADVDPDFGLRLASAMVWFWECRGPVSEGRDRIARTLARESGTPEIRMKALVANGWLAHIQRDSGAARSLLDEAMVIAEQVDDRWTVAWILHLLGRVAYFDGDADRARQFGEQCLAAAHEIGDEWLAGWAYHLMALAAHIGGDLSRAHEHYSASLKIRNEVGYPEGIATVTGLLGMLALREGDHVAALNRFRSSLEINRQLGARWLVVNMLANIVLISVTAGDSRRAATLAGFVDAVSDDLGADPIPIAEATLREGVHAARMALGDGAYDELSANGRKMTMNDAIILALELAEPLTDPEPAVESGQSPSA